ncbi:MAG: hypothetical protein ACR2RF_26305 [Geminicoccaceae bacterium]
MSIFVRGTMAPRGLTEEEWRDLCRGHFAREAARCGEPTFGDPEKLYAGTVERSSLQMPQIPAIQQSVVE